MKPEYPQTAETIARAQRSAESDARAVRDLDVLDRMVKLHGSEKVHKWLRNVAALNGQSMPCDGPLAS